MSEEAFSQLCKEISKFVGFRIQDDLKQLANATIKDNAKSQIELPFEDCSNNAVKFITTLLDSGKYNTPQTLIFPRLIKSIQNQVFAGDALRAIMSSFTSISHSLDNEQSMQILQLITEGISFFFPSIPNLESIFTIILTLIARNDVLISTTAYAFFPQLMSSLHNLAKINQPSDGFIEFCFSNYGNIFQRFEKPFNFIFYLLYSDLTHIALKQPMIWLKKLKMFPTSVIYDLLDLIVNNYSETLMTEPQLICVFDGAIIQAMDDKNALQFVICFIDTFLESHASLCMSLFEDYLSKISQKNSQNYIPLFFFKGISTRHQNLPSRLFITLDKGNSSNHSLFIKLVDALSALKVTPDKPMQLSLKPDRIDTINNPKGQIDFTLQSPFEIICGILNSFSFSIDDHMNIWASHASKTVMKMLITALKYTSLETFKIALEGISNLLIIMHKTIPTSSLLDEIFTTVCNISTQAHISISQDLSEKEQQIFQSFDKQGIYNQFLCRLAESYPNICNGHWLMILTAIFKSKTTLSLDFASTFTQNDLRSIVEVVIAINPLPYDFIATLVSANMERFECIWEVLKPFFIFNMKEDESDKNVILLLLELISRSITEKNEEAIFEIAGHFVSPQSCLVIEDKDRILSKLRQFLAESASIVKKGWDNLFLILDPSNFDQHVDTVQSSFSVLTLLCNDDITLIPQKSMKPLIELIFKFADDGSDINLSLSSFDLLWGVVRVMDDSIDNWSFLMSEVLRLIQDRRNDVSQCAIRTFFSLMSSNFEQIPSEVINVFVSSTFIKILNSIDFKVSDERANDFELALQEMSHYTSTFWEKFERNPDFNKIFLPALISKAELFCSTCNNQELVTNAFQFYEALFTCNTLHTTTETQLRDSLIKLARLYSQIEDVNSIIYSCYGRLISVILATLITRNVINTLPSWFPLIRLIVTKMVSPIYVHITVQRTLDVLPQFFPFDKQYDEIGHDVVGLLVEFSLGNTTRTVQEFLIRLLCKIVDKISKDSPTKSIHFDYVLKCKPLLMIEASQPLIKAILEAKIEFDDSQATDVFDYCTSIKKIYPGLRHLADVALVFLIDRGTENQQKDFITNNQDDFEIVELLWMTFFDQSSNKFNQTVYDNCIDITLKAIRNTLMNYSKTVTSPEEQNPEAETCQKRKNLVLIILNFLVQSKLPPKTDSTFPPNSTKWHLVELMKAVISTLATSDEKIVFAAKEVLEQAAEVVSEMI